MCNSKIECIDIFEEEEEEEKFVKKCPKCGRDQVYSSKYTLARAIKKNCLCQTCFLLLWNHRFSPEERKRNMIRRKKNSKLYAKKYYQINKTSILKRNKKHRQKPETKEKDRKRYKKDIKNPLFRLNKNLSCSLRNSLKSINLSKNGKHWEFLVRYTIYDLKKHLEKYFLPGMSWKNYGKNGWVIDHIIPRVFFDFKDTNSIEFLYRWSLNNLRPMWKKNNESKGDKITIWGKEINARYIERDYFSEIDSFHIN